MPLELRRQFAVGFVVFRHDKQSAGLFVDPVDDSGAKRAVDPRKFAPAMVKQGVHQRPRRVARRGVDHHARRLVDNQKIPILVNDIERDLFGRGVDGFGFGQGDPDLVPRRQPVVLIGGLAVQGNVPFRDQFCRGGTGKSGKTFVPPR